MVLVTLLGVGLIQLDHESEYGDLSFLEDISFHSIWIDSFTAPVSFAWWDSFSIILILEYLRSHIGKKEPPDEDSKLTHSDLPINFRTALLCSAVFL